MSGRIKIKSKDKDKRPKIDVFKVIENRFKNMNELRDLIDMDPRKGLVRIRDGAGFREVERGGMDLVVADNRTVPYIYLLNVIVAEEDLKLMKYGSKHDYSFVPKI